MNNLPVTTKDFSQVRRRRTGSLNDGCVAAGDGGAEAAKGSPGEGPRLMKKMLHPDAPGGTESIGGL